MAPKEGLKVAEKTFVASRENDAQKKGYEDASKHGSNLVRTNKVCSIGVNTRTRR